MVALRIRKKAGFVLLYAVLVSGIILGVGLSLINLFTKQIILSSIGRNSQFAYYAADAGKQCAYFWYASYYSAVFGVLVNNQVNPPTSSDLPSTLFQAGTGQVSIFCNNRPLIINYEPSSESSKLISNFTLPLSPDPNQPSCAKVQVTRKIAAGQVETMIRSSGYNASCGDLGDQGKKNPRRIERVVYRFINDTSP